MSTVLNIDLIVETCLGCLTDKDEFSEETKKEAGNIIRACVVVLCEHDYHPAEIKNLLTEHETNFGCWLETIERILDEGLQKLPSEYEENTKALIKGAFLMVRPFIYDLDGWNDQWEGRIKKQAKM